jgi:hypothetical protein
MEKIKRIRIILIAIGVFLQAFGFFLGIYSVIKMVTYPIGITLLDIIYPYHFEGITLMT